MRVRVLYFGVLKEVAGTAQENVQLEPGSNIARLFDVCAGKFPRMAGYSESLLFSRNQEFAGRNEPLEEGDEVGLLPPVSGGAPENAAAANDEKAVESEAVVCRIVTEPIDTPALVKQLQADEDGAVVVFEGVVRNHSKGRRTLFLEYDAYVPMALGKMKEICEGLRDRLGIHRIGMVHRIGRMEIGEASVVIVVTSAHRRQAFEASREAIDRLKQTVPIWKKEYFEDGAVWVEGESQRGIPAAASAPDRQGRN